MSFPRYERYKESGVEWLGEVPEHWDVLGLKRAFTIVGGSTPTSGVDEYWGDGCVWVTPADLSKSEGQYIYRSERTITKQGLRSCSSSLVPVDSIVLSTRAPIGSLALAGVELCTNQGCKSLVPLSGTISAFYAFLLAVIGEQLQIRGKGTTFLEISSDALGSVEVPSPPSEEQRQICSFLQVETAKIDALIEEQRRLIELLKEKRQAVISHAVTKGLNPEACFEESLIEWITYTPNNWSAMPLRRLISLPLINGIFKKREEFGTGTLLVNVFDIYRNDFKIDFLDLDRVSCSPNEVETYKVLEGDIFFVRSSLKAEGIAAVALAQEHYEPVVFECHLIRARLERDLLNARYCSYVLSSSLYRSKTFSLAKITTMTTLDQESLLSLVLPVPPIEEQREIAQFLDKESFDVAELISFAETAITLLEERRSALISAAVTGKIDVRHYTPKEAA